MKYNNESAELRLNGNGETKGMISIENTFTFKLITFITAYYYYLLRIVSRKRYVGCVSGTHVHWRK